MDGEDKVTARPAHLPPYAEACLRALAERGFGDKLSLGGGLGLLHYLDYRPTHDVDAWWDTDATPEERNAIIRVIEDTLRSLGRRGRAGLGRGHQPRVSRSWREGLQFSDR